MKRKLQFSLDEIRAKLDTLNSNVSIPNEFILAKCNGNNVDFSLKVNDEVVFTLPKAEFPCFNYRDNFVGKLDFDTNEVELFTFADLHTHTEYSILDGANRIKDLAEKYPYAGAITDHGVMYGCIDFYKKMHDLHKKPIIGFEAYTTSIEGEEKKHHLVLLATSEKGYSNLVKLCSYGQSNFGGSYPKRPIITLDELVKYKEDLIVLSACLGGEIPQKILRGDKESLYKTISFFKENFGDNYYFEIQRHASTKIYEDEIFNIESQFGLKLDKNVILDDFNKTMDSNDAKFKKKDFQRKYSKILYENLKLIIEEGKVNEEILRLSKEFNIKVVATNDAHYLNPEDATMHEALLCNQTQKKLTDPNHWIFPGEGYYVHTTDDMERRFHDLPELLINSLEIIDKCNFDFTFGEYKLPKFPIPDGYTDVTYLEKLVWDGFDYRFKGHEEYNDTKYRERVDFELKTIFKMGYQGYFYIVWDYIKWAKENGIYVGPGRGSGAGSIVLYCLRITENLDPLKFDLLFERFLNPDRISMPDIDVDFEYELREKVIDYCKSKYGEDCVSRIITFGTMAAKGAIGDMARVLDYPVELSRKITKMIPKGVNVTIKRALLENVELDTFYNNDADAKKIIDLAMKVEGLIRNTSCHACGVIIAPSDITNYCPQVFAKDEDTGLYERTTQYVMTECEEIGLLKMDVRIVR